MSIAAPPFKTGTSRHCFLYCYSGYQDLCKIVSVLNSSKKVPFILSNEEKQALRNWSNKEIITTHADKGNCTVVLDKSDDSRINDLLCDSNTYGPLKSDLTGNIERKT